jgi:hypothetical protein
MSILGALLTLCLLICLASAQQILGAEPDIDFSNAGFMNRLQLKFKLSVSTSTTDYLVIAFPFPLHAALTAGFSRPATLSVPKNLYLSWSLLYANGSTEARSHPAFIYT